MLNYKKMDLFVTITKEGPGYSAAVIGFEKKSSEEGTELLRTSKPVNRMLLEQILESFGFHERDIFDALDVSEGNSVNIKHPLW